MLFAMQGNTDWKMTRINTCSGAPAGPTDVSRGIFGATVGIDRILKLLDKYKIKATWFVPGHSVESFPSQMNKVRDGGHEMFVIRSYCIPYRRRLILQWLTWILP